MEQLVSAALESQGLWAALFIILLAYVLKTTGDRESRLISALDKLSEQLEVVRDVKDGVDRIERKINSRKET